MLGRRSEGGRHVWWIVLALAAVGSYATGPLAAEDADTVISAGAMGESGIGQPTANTGENVAIHFFYQEPVCHIQGYSLSLQFDCELVGLEGSFSVEDTIVEAVGVEFVSQSVDNDPADGDGCEMVLAVLLDTIPPFDGQTLPQTVQPLSLGFVELFVPDDIDCFATYDVELIDGLNGAETIPIFNTVVIENQSVAPTALNSTSVAVPTDILFLRGDIDDNGMVALADAIFIINYLFVGGPAPLCFDAADVDDNGQVQLLDTFFLIYFLFIGGDPPPPPFPGCGFESQDDDDLICTEPLLSCPGCP